MRSLALLLILGGCAATTTRSGRANLVTAGVEIEGEALVTRPSEVGWSMGTPMAHQTVVTERELAADMWPGAVLFQGPGGAEALPPAVRFASARAAGELKADGLLLTHYTIETVRDGADLRHTINLFGRPLHLSDLGVVDAARVDQVEALEQRLARSLGLEPAMPSPRRGAKSAAPPPSPPPAPRPAPPPPPPPEPTLSDPPPVPAPEAE